MKTLGLLLAAALLLAGCGSGSVASVVGKGDTKLGKAYNDCLSEVNVLSIHPENGTVELADHRKSFIVDGASADKAFEAVACVLSGIGTSSATISRMDATTAMMGGQHAESDDFTYDWSYHPDNGMNLTVQEK